MKLTGHGLRRRLASSLAATGEPSDFDRLASLTTIARSRTDPPMLFHTSDREMGPHIWQTSGYDDTEMTWALEHLGHPQRGRTVVEVGANVGTTTVALLTRLGASKVEAFEPEPTNARLLRCNLILNELEDRVHFHQVAVSDSNGQVEMELCDWNRGDHRVRATSTDWEVLAESNREIVTVPSARLDDVLCSSHDEVGLVWVDTQGHEAQVMEGAPNLLESGVPWLIEYWPYGLRRAGGLERLNDLLLTRFSRIVDVRLSLEAGRTVELTAESLGRPGEAPGLWYTDLILLP